MKRGLQHFAFFYVHQTMYAALFEIAQPFALHLEIHPAARGCGHTDKQLHAGSIKPSLAHRLARHLLLEVHVGIII